MIGIRITDLAHEFDNREVFRDLSFAFDGACFAVTGHNGSGKSTLLRILAGLLTPVSGKAVVTIDGEPVPRSALRDVIGIAAPDIRLYSDLTPRENLRFLMRARGSVDYENAISAALDRVGLAQRADDTISELSSGLRQRAALAAAIVYDPVVLLLDEPSSNLDEAGVCMVRELVSEQAKRGMVVIATNDASEASLAAARLELGGRE